jgi:uncharacterized protein GlcG (DUF336 family)
MIKINRLELPDALLMIEAAEQRARALGVPETICVCDEGGHAIAAAGHKRPTHRFTQPGGPALPGGEAFGINMMYPGKFAIFVGGFPIEHEGEVVGGIGVSGGNGEQDTAVGTAALEAFSAHVATG